MKLVDGGSRGAGGWEVGFGRWEVGGGRGDGSEIGWLGHWVVGWLVCWLLGWLAGSLMGGWCLTGPVRVALRSPFLSLPNALLR